MRLYKLLKDTPTIKAGTMFREVVSDYDGARELARVTPIGAKTNPQWTIQDINNFDCWFEEIQEKDLSILDCEIAVDGEDIDLDEWRDPSDTDS